MEGRLGKHYWKCSNERTSCELPVLGLSWKIYDLTKEMRWSHLLQGLRRLDRKLQMHKANLLMRKSWFRLYSWDCQTLMNLGSLRKEPQMTTLQKLQMSLRH